MSARFNDLREHFAQHQLLGKILAADDNSISMAGATEEWQKEDKGQQRTDDLLAADFLQSTWQVTSSF
jgi:transketolase